MKSLRLRPSTGSGRRLDGAEENNLVNTPLCRGTNMVVVFRMDVVNQSATDDRPINLQIAQYVVLYGSIYVFIVIYSIFNLYI